MKLFSTEAKVGVVVLAALAGLTWLTFQIGEFRFKEKGYTIEAVFRTVSGLETEAKVRMAGVLVGSVDRIYLKEGRAHVVLRLDDGVVVHEDSAISVSSIGILAERYVEITAGSQGARALEPGAVVAGKELMDLDQLMAEFTRASESFRSLAASIQETISGRDSAMAQLLASTRQLVEHVDVLVEENRRSVRELLSQSAGLARDTRSLVADARTLVSDTRAVVSDNREELRQAVAGLHRLAETLNRRADQVADEATKTAAELRDTVRGSREDLQQVLTSMRAAAGSAEKAADTLTKILAKVDAGQGTIGRLVNDDTTIDRVDAAAGDISGIARKINEGEGTLGRLVNDDALVDKLENTADSAERLLGAGDRIHFYLGYRGEYLGRGGDVKSYVSVKLQPQADKYYLLEVVDDPAGKTTTTTTQTTIERPEGGYTINETQTETDENKLKFSLLFAKDFGPLTFRGGLMESQGGAGLEYHLPLGRPASLGLDSWDYGRDDGGPHLKLTGKLALYKDVFLTAGVDDVANEKRRSVFLGGGILFSDEDLRQLLNLATLGK